MPVNDPLRFPYRNELLLPVIGLEAEFKVFVDEKSVVPEELWGKREAAEVFHEILEHRWYLSQASGADVGLDRAVASYVDNVLRHVPDERTVLEDVREGPR